MRILPSYTRDQRLTYSLKSWKSIRPVEDRKWIWSSSGWHKKWATISFGFMANFLNTSATLHRCRCQFQRPGVNFTNILQEAFARIDPKSTKDSQVISYFVLLGSMHIKAVCKHDDEIEPSI